jgi:hypothetical protein
VERELPFSLFILTSLILGVHRHRPVVLGVAATNLLRARNDPDAQRLWMGDIHSLLGLYPRKSEVTQCISVTNLTGLSYLVSLETTH